MPPYGEDPHSPPRAFHRVRNILFAFLSGIYEMGNPIFRVAFPIHFLLYKSSSDA